MKLIMRESNHLDMKNTVVGYLVDCNKLKQFVEFLYNDSDYLELRVGFENNDGEKTGYILINGAAKNDDEFKRFKNNKALNLNLLADIYEITIKTDEFERECFIYVTPYNYNIE